MARRRWLFTVLAVLLVAGLLAVARTLYPPLGVVAMTTRATGPPPPAPWRRRHDYRRARQRVRRRRSAVRGDPRARGHRFAPPDVGRLRPESPPLEQPAHRGAPRALARRP